MNRVYTYNEKFTVVHIHSGEFKEKRARHLPAVPLFRVLSRCFAYKCSSVLVKNVLSTHIIYTEADHMYCL